MDRTPLPSLRYVLELPEVMPAETDLAPTGGKEEVVDDSVKMNRSSAKIDEL